MTYPIERRSLGLLAVGGALVLGGRDTAAQQPQITSEVTSLIASPAVANCQSLSTLDQRLAAEAARSATMLSTETDAEVAAINAALARRATLVQETQAALASARLDLAKRAAVGTVDFVIAACLAKQDAVCIGSAYGVKIVAGTAEAGVQIYRARTQAEQAVVLVSFARQRVLLLKDLTSDLKPEPVHKAGIKALQRVRKIGTDLGKAGAQVAQSSDDFKSALAALQELDQAYSRILVNEKTYREFRREHFEAQRWLVRLLIQAQLPNCRIDTPSIPKP